MITLIFLLLICHWLGDFTKLNHSKMLKAKSIGKPLFPILLHAFVHGFLMMLVLLFYTTLKNVIILVVFQIVTHFIIDTLKGKSSTWFPKLKDISNVWFWTVFGFDQLLHQCVILLMVHFIYI